MYNPAPPPPPPPLTPPLGYYKGVRVPPIDGEKCHKMIMVKMTFFGWVGGSSNDDVIHRIDG